MPRPGPEILLRVERPGRYAGGEFGAVRPSDRPRPVGTICLVFPDVYEIGTSNLGLRILAAEVNAESDLLAERAFAPWPDMAAAIETAGIPLGSIESGRPLRDFDVVGISLPHELAATAVLRILTLGGIPPRASERTRPDPIVLAGGGWACHAAAVEPFLDALFVGEGEGALPAIVRETGEARLRGEPREAIIERLGRRPEILVPALRGTDSPGGRAVRRIAPGPPRVAPFVSGPVPSIAAVFDRVTVEVARGCGGGCRFCQAGWTLRPERPRPLQSVVEEIAASLRHTGYDEVSLSALSTADYPDLGPLIESLAPLCDTRKVALGISSLRAYGLPDAVLETLGRTRRTGITLAPEAGTQRLRDVISKRVSEDDLLGAVRRAAGAGWRRVKLYFMIGLPTETDDDVAAVADLSLRVASAGRAAGDRSFAATISVSNFVPKPHTPFQWEPMIPLDEIRRRQEILRRLLRGRRAEIKLHDPRAGVLEALLARGGPETAAAVFEAFRRGAYLDAWTERFRWETWLEALAATGISPDDATRPLDPGAPTPWSHVDVGVSTGFLLRERERALAGEPGERCDPAPERFRCQGCGVGCRQEGAGGGGRGVAVGGRESGVAGRDSGPAVVGPPVWFRIVVRKTGPAIYIGHLDFVRAIAQALRRAGLPLSYTKGFHPGPRISMTSPLALGIAGLAEPGDVHLDFAPDDVPSRLDRLRALTPDGIEFTDLRPLGETNPRTARLASHADCVVTTPGLDEAGARTAVERAGRLEAWPIDDPRRGRRHGWNARPHVASLDAGPLGASSSALGAEPAGWGLLLRTALDPAPPIRLLGALLLGIPESRVSAVRVAVVDSGGRMVL